MTATFIMPITLTYADLARARVAILRAEGALDRSSFDELIAQAWAARDAGAHHLIVDMSDVERVSTAGLVGLHAVALIAQGAAPPDPMHIKLVPVRSSRRVKAGRYWDASCVYSCVPCASKPAEWSSPPR
jgi:ABC-type transporter Mla MlaB component